MKFYIETYGCQMNISDSAYIREFLINKGLKESNSIKETDIIIVNTCSVRRSAEERLEGRLSYYTSLKKEKDVKIFVIGCYAQKEQENIRKKYPNIDFIIGTRNISKIQEIIDDIESYENKIFTSLEKEYIEPAKDPSNPFRAFITIIKGCNNYCSYCIVPYTRGPEYSINSRKIIEDIKRLVDNGVKEVFLLGQNVNSYGIDSGDIRLHILLEKINNIKGIERIRFLTSHPKDFSYELIEAVTKLEKVVKQVHLPLQSGSDKVLKLMNRKYSLKHYLDIIEKLRKNMSSISITTDILVGFPGEDEEDFIKTYNAVKEIEFDKAFMFMYSPREGTKSYELKETVTLEEKKERLIKIINIQNEITVKRLKRFIGKKMTAFVENYSKKNNGVLASTYYGIPAIIDKNIKKGEIVDIKIKSISGHTLIAE